MRQKPESLYGLFQPRDNWTKSYYAYMVLIIAVVITEILPGVLTSNIANSHRNDMKDFRLKKGQDRSRL